MARGPKRVTTRATRAAEVEQVAAVELDVTPAPGGDEAPQADPALMEDGLEAAAIRARALREGKRLHANERVPRLSYPKRPGWHQCWMNDVPGNLAHALDLGYSFRIDPITKERVKRVVGVQAQGGGLDGYLMEIPLEIYNEDQKILEATMAKVDQQIFRGEMEGSEKDTGIYMPSDDGQPRSSVRTAVTR